MSETVDFVAEMLACIIIYVMSAKSTVASTRDTNPGCNVTCPPLVVVGASATGLGTTGESDTDDGSGTSAVLDSGSKVEGSGALSGSLAAAMSSEDKRKFDTDSELA